MRKVKRTKQFGRVGFGRRKLITKFEIAKLELHDGDVLVLRTDLMLSRDQIREFHARADEEFSRHFPDVKVVVLGSGISLAVLQDKRQPKRRPKTKNLKQLGSNRRISNGAQRNQRAVHSAG